MEIQCTALGEDITIKGRHEDGCRQMASRDEQDEGANEMDGALAGRGGNSLEASHLPCKAVMEGLIERLAVTRGYNVGFCSL
jgi:hypothetical protein